MPGNKDSAAEFYVQFLAEMERYAGILPGYLEPFNEPDTVLNFVYEWNDVLDLHNKIFQKVRNKFPSVNVGAPCSWGIGRLEENGYTKRWIKIWKPVLDLIIDEDYDYFAFHVNDSFVPSDVLNPHWGNSKDGRWIGTMDLIQAYYQQYFPGTCKKALIFKTLIF